ncbi:hypothetical protein H257_15853 [Aphanomyces astaci]|uniref:Myb-like domain-containing protein n=1 Tax=Aphanomyces astaci TaxID=112090 RepID=W4FMJ3_APHAT|nr:hypothetical protein H257_15853 [Aphanomyces astaci]ETV68106.1 hypothetical protein H257_15853 [Aphanomyces astaci]|eukprot:XP_009842405.1 hypothetical protein H257_15853 [Aphanomyces astaci]
MSKSKEMHGLDDVHQQAELLVLDYLRGSRCMKTMDALSKWISDKKKHRSSSALMSPTASDIFAKDVAANKATKEKANSVLEYMIGKRKSGSKSPKVSCSPEAFTDGKVDETTMASTTKGASKEWTKDDLSKLKKEAKKTQTIADKTERWKSVGATLGRSKRDCYEKYKELKKKPSSSSSKPSKKAVTVDVRSMLDLNAIDVAGAGTDGRASDDVEPSGATAVPTNPNEQDMGMSSSPTIHAVNVHYAKDKTGPKSTGKNKIVDAANMVDDHPSEMWCGEVALSKPKARGSSVAPGDVRASRDYDDVAVMEDCDNLDEQDHAQADSAPPSRSSSSFPSRVSLSNSVIDSKQGRALPAAEVTSLRKLLFNDSKKKLGPHWTHQGFDFAQVEGLKYGIVQHEGGPCGVMAVVQAYVLHFLFQEDISTWDSVETPLVTKALARALAHIIWQAGSGSTCKVALIGGATPSLEHMAVSQLNSRHDLDQFIARHIDQFRESKGYGVVLVVASVMLTRGLATVEADMDTATGTVPTLIGAHDYCTQEMVNLLLLGYACSNVFDGTKDLGGGDDATSSSMVLRGVQKRSAVGFLTLFEAYDYMVVGDHLKVPVDNIWVVCSESHYSVMFADPAIAPSTSLAAFDLFYFDGLANQDEVIRLTISPMGLATKPDKAAQNRGDLIPPLNLVIQTKWPQATVDWHSVEPLL